MAVYDPALMLLGSWQDSVYVIVQGSASRSASGVRRSSDISGRRLSRVERVGAVVAACLLVAAVPATDAIGFAMAAAFGLYHAATSRGQRAAVS